MDTRINRVAALANAAIYGSRATSYCVDGSPHIKHSVLRNLYGRLVVTVYDFAAKYTSAPKILDLGAGEGSATLPFLELGARVTAVDISESQVKALEVKCAKFAGKLEVRCEDVFDAIKTIQRAGNQYDVIVANSFLHHVPDYIGLISRGVAVLSGNGQFFSFQDPLRYNSIGRSTSVFSTLAYLSWRIFKGDMIGGLKRRIRRSRGKYLDQSLEDSFEYHVIRGGVDQDAIQELFNQLGFECEVVRYFSTQSRIWQPVGTTLRMKNTFAVIARRTSCL